MNKKIVMYVVAAVLIIGVAGIFISRRADKQLMTNSSVNEEKKQSMPATESNNNVVPAQAKKMEVTLGALNNSGESGVAVLEEVDGKTKVDLKLTGAPQGVLQPAHIHVGVCPGIGAVKYALNFPMNGVSTTTLNVSLDQILNELPLAINVHKSASEANVYFACGDIKKAEVGAQSSSNSSSQPASSTVNDDSQGGGGSFATPDDRRKGADKPED